MASRTQKLKQKSQSNLSLSESQIKETLVPLVVEQIKAEIRVSETFSGPYPHPKHVVVYEEIYPGFLKEGVEMAKVAQSNHAKSTARTDWHDFSVKITSLVLVGLVACGSIAGAIYLLANDKNGGALAVVFGGLAPVLYSIWNNKDKNKTTPPAKP